MLISLIKIKEKTTRSFLAISHKKLDPKFKKFFLLRIKVPI